MKKPLPKQKYQSEFYKIVPTAIFGLAGLFYTFSPYEIKLGAGLDFGNSPEEHIIFGVVFLGIAVVFWILNNRKKPILP